MLRRSFLAIVLMLLCAACGGTAPAEPSAGSIASSPSATGPGSLPPASQSVAPSASSAPTGPITMRSQLAEQLTAAGFDCLEQEALSNCMVSHADSGVDYIVVVNGASVIGSVDVFATPLKGDKLNFAAVADFSAKLAALLGEPGAGEWLGANLPQATAQTRVGQLRLVVASNDSARPEAARVVSLLLGDTPAPVIGAKAQG